MRVEYAIYIKFSSLMQLFYNLIDDILILIT